MLLLSPRLPGEIVFVFPHKTNTDSPIATRFTQVTPKTHTAAAQVVNADLAIGVPAPVIL